jgi:hypothetical protein
MVDGIRSTGEFHESLSVVIAKVFESEKMYEYFMGLKQKDGSFLVTKHGEVDVRCVPNCYVRSDPYPLFAEAFTV